MRNKVWAEIEIPPDREGWNLFLLFPVDNSDFCQNHSVELLRGRYCISLFCSMGSVFLQLQLQLGDSLGLSPNIAEEIRPIDHHRRCHVEDPEMPESFGIRGGSGLG